MTDDSFQTFSHRIEEAVDTIPSMDVIGTKRKGFASLRDKLVFGKAAWTEALGYFAIVQAIIIFTALVPNAIQNVNSVLKPTGLQLPIVASSVIAFIFILFLFIFGFLSYRYFGTAKRSAEIGAKLSSCDFIEWKDLQTIKQGIEDLKKQIEEMKKGGE